MSEHDDAAHARKKLQTLLSAAGFTHQRLAAGGRTMSFSGRYRDWLLVASANPGWFHVHTVICSLPAEPGLRGELLLWLARANADLSLLKYSVTKADKVVLEAEVRMEKLEAEDVGNLVWFVHATAEEHYLDVFRIARGEARLDALSTAFARDAVTGEGSVSA
jgi:hypothetical protein